VVLIVMPAVALFLSPFVVNTCPDIGAVSCIKGRHIAVSSDSLTAAETVLIAGSKNEQVSIGCV